MGLLCGQSKALSSFESAKDQLFIISLSAFFIWLFSLPSLFLPSQPFLPLSDSNALCDSDESGAEDDEDDDDAFLSDTQITEHSDPNSYR